MLAYSSIIKCSNRTRKIHWSQKYVQKTALSFQYSISTRYAFNITNK